MKKTTTAAVAVIATLGLAFLLAGCGGAKKVENGFEEVITPTSELRKKCLSDYKDYYCGVGDEVSNDEYTATTIAETKSRANLATSISSLVKRVVGVSTENTSDKEAVSGAVERIGEETKQDLVDVSVAETKTLFNKETNQYHAYVMTVTNKKDFLAKLKARVSASQELAKLAHTAQVMAAINKEVESTENFLDR